MEAFPELAEKGAYSADEIYTREDIKQVIQYANEVSSTSNPHAARTQELTALGIPELSERHRRSDGMKELQITSSPLLIYLTNQEMDSPGHTTAISAAHPEHIACAAKSPWSKYASEPPAGQLRIASPSTVSFARTMFSSVAATLPGTMMSSGGDEVNLPCWEEDEQTIADLAARNISIADALNEFVQTVQGVITGHGKIPFIKSG